MLGTGEADVGVLDLAGRRVGRLGRVVEVPVRELLRLRARVAVEGAEDHPERVDRGQERAQVGGHAEERVPAAAVELQRDDLVLGPEARERRDARQREAADDHAAVGERHHLAEAGHAVEVLVAAHRGDHRAGRHEEQRLEEGVRHQVEHAGGVRGRGDGHDHVADLRHRRVRDDALEVGHDEADRGRDQQRDRADDRADRGRVRRVLEQRVQARDQVHAGGHHRRRMDQGADRGRALHGVREPGVQRDLGGLGERADQQQDAARDQLRLVRRRTCRRRPPRTS